jgi:ApaG protein
MHDDGSSHAVTHDIRVEVDSHYVPERSDPRIGRWFFAYRIRITNQGARTVQLLSRRWVIIDARGGAEEVAGPGVVGEQPVLEPGETFEYTSFCPLPTPFGSMEGSYTMADDAGGEFEVAVARFTLSEPLKVN